MHIVLIEERGLPGVALGEVTPLRPVTQRTRIERLDPTTIGSARPYKSQIPIEQVLIVA
jgi:hypothetical protein